MRDALSFLGRNWMWWVPPLLVAALLAGMLLSGEAESPFAYPPY